MADAAVAAVTSPLNWSALPDFTELTDKKLNGTVHWHRKANMGRHIRGWPVLDAYYMPACPMQDRVFKLRPVNPLQLSYYALLF